MNILQVVHFFNPARGGAVTSTYNLSKNLAKLGHDVTIFTSDLEFNYEYADSLKGVTIIPFPCITNIGMLLVSPRMKKQLKKDIKKFDIIHMNSFRTYQNMVAYKFAKKNGIPYVLQTRGDIPRFEGKQRLKFLYDTIWGKRIIRDASKIIFSSRLELRESQKDFLIPRTKYDFIPNGIDIPESCIFIQGAFREKLSINKDEKIILYLGRINSGKGIKLIVKSFSEVNKIINNIKLVFVGLDEGYSSNVMKLANNLGITDKIIFTGPLLDEQKFQAYSDSDVFLLPSRYESFGNTILEAFACNTPVIVTKDCGVTEWISEDMGCIINYDEEQLKEAILKILTNEKIRVKFEDNCRKLVKTMFNWENIARITEKMYKNLLITKYN
jgi:glycosyltransferase involved in cell wall biosynthesis